jgi:astacin (peptidase family M12A)
MRPNFRAAQESGFSKLGDAEQEKRVPTEPYDGGEGRFRMKLRHCLLFVAYTAMIHLAFAGFVPEQNVPLTAQDINNLTRGRSILTDRAGRQEIVIDDMVFDLHELQTRGFAGARWPSGEIYIAFDSNLNALQQRKFLDACGVWTAVAHVKCIPWTNQRNYALVVQIANDPRYCVSQSRVGMLGGQQKIEIGSACWNFKF